MKKEDKTELSRQRILSAAMDEFGARGYAGASLNSICAAGIAKGLLYHNFEGKDALYLACVEESFSGLTKALRAAEIGADFKKYTEVRLHFFTENERQARVFFDALLQPPEPLKERIAELRREFDLLNAELCRGILGTVRLRQEVSESDAMDYFAMLQTMFNGYFSSPACRALSFEEKMSAHEEKLGRLLDLMLYGIADKGDK